ncbi:hypothetical protein BHE90_009067 [Fusarium euwallaceae]|uniref:Heterokaryon incompatibility domain-containing protein n=1 Tax=Fusarium euwallaceae TaxID=1147111 RepID=A0A430LLA4_9HYPO|nr:hypothetical protein BHE90_009067 [Fusarium euwallaceae]
MRLLNTGILEVEEFGDDQVPPYAILSHTWGDEEVTLQDIGGIRASNKKGYEKIKSCCSLARAHGYNYVWIDTCCIDKTSSAELSEAINSMYRWYEEADVCYCYLSDVPSKTNFSGSRWFTRGWTLQELIAPSTLIFLDEEWKQLGTGAGLRQEISDCTGIPIGILSGDDDLETFSIAQRMSWAGKRRTSRIEDGAYCLLGIFGINMPLIYGERETAFIRLQEEIMRISDDHSLFAWKSTDNRGGLLATSPAAFISSNNIVQFNPFDTFSNPVTVSSRGVHLELRFIGTGPRGLGLAILHCKERGGDEKPIAIYLRDIALTMDRFERVRSEEFEPLDLRTFRPSRFPMRRMCIQKGRLTRRRKTGGGEKCDGIAANASPEGMGAHLEGEQESRPGEALLQAAERGIDDHVWLMLTQSDVEAALSHQDWWAALMGAVRGGHEVVVKILLARSNIKIDLEHEEGTLLWWAARMGHEAVVKALLKSGIDADSGDGAEWRPLAEAAGEGHEAVVRLLLDRGANIDAKDESGRTPLLWASKEGHEAIVRLLLDRGANIDAKDESGRTPLLWASKEGHEAIVRLLLDRGANIDAKGESGRTPLSWAAEEGHEAVAQLLLDRGADIRIWERDHSDLFYRVDDSLLLSYYEGYETTVRLVLDMESGDDDWGRMTLSRAAQTGNEAAVRLLLDRGISMESRDDNQGRTPLQWAAKEGHEAVVRLLLDRGASMESRDNYWSKTPLQWAAERWHDNIVRLLLDRGANIESEDRDGCTALFQVLQCWRSQETIMRMLLDQGANIETKDDCEGQTPLLYAAGLGFEVAVTLLLDKGANMESKDTEGFTPLIWAILRGCEAVVLLLLKGGADIESKDYYWERSPLSRKIVMA